MRRRFRWIDGGWIHDRSAGSGPVVIAFHGSPQSSAALGPLMAACVQRGLQVIAPDTPGNGLSDPLSQPCEIADYAARIVTWMASLGVERAALYGFHTGAAIAATIAVQRPQSVSALLLDGLPVWTDEEREDLLAHYLPPFQAQWDGGHLAWAWARMEEQSIFFPWYMRDEASRLIDYSVAAPALLHANAMDLFRAGDAYRLPYSAAFRFRAAPVLAGISSPCWATAQPGDPLCAHLQRLAPKDGVRIAPAPSSRDARMVAFADYLAQHADAKCALPHDHGRRPDGEVRGFLSSSDGLLGFRGPQNAAALWLHDAGESIAAGAPTGVMRLDLPGHGEGGETWASIPQTPQGLGECLRAAITDLGSPKPSGRGLGARIAAALRGETSAAIGDQPPPDLSPRWDGSQLISAWRYLRRRAVYAPWNQPDTAHYRTPQGDLEPTALQAQLLDLFLCGRHLGAAFEARNA